MQLALSGKVIGLANKECIICLGRLFLDKANSFSTKIIPLDSEHNAIYQLIKNKDIGAASIHRNQTAVEIFTTTIMLI